VTATIALLDEKSDSLKAAIPSSDRDAPSDIELLPQGSLVGRVSFAAASKQLSPEAAKAIFVRPTYQAFIPPYPAPQTTATDFITQVTLAPNGKHIIATQRRGEVLLFERTVPDATTLPDPGCADLNGFKLLKKFRESPGEVPFLPPLFRKCSSSLVFLLRVDGSLTSWSVPDVKLVQTLMSTWG